MAKKSNGKSLLQRLRFKYKVAILNENTLEEVWRIRLSKLSVIGLVFLIAVIYFFLIALLIIKTPLKGFIPEYAKAVSVRKNLILTAMKVDSLTEEMHKQIQYTEALRDAMEGKITIDSFTTREDLLKLTTNDLLATSEKELAYRDTFESDEVITLGIGSSTPNVTKNYLMQKPVKGKITQKFSTIQKKLSIKLNAENNSSIFSILDGIVVSSQYTISDNYTLIVQHPDNMLSIYTAHAPFIKKVGDKVVAGEILTTLLDNTDTNVEFQLWKDGNAVDPESFIVF